MKEAEKIGEDLRRKIEKDAEEAYEDLKLKKYDDMAIFRFAKAARSWCEKFSPKWFMWSIAMQIAEKSSQ